MGSPISSDIVLKWLKAMLLSQDWGSLPTSGVRLLSDVGPIINSSGSTDFNPELKLALSTNIDGVANLIDFQKECRRAALLHLSTCYVIGFRDGRIGEELISDYNPRRAKISAQSASIFI